MASHQVLQVGFAPVKSIVEDAFERGLSRPMTPYWGVRRRADLYMAAVCEIWQGEHANFTFVPVLSEPLSGDAWTGRTGLVHEAIWPNFPTGKATRSTCAAR
ncbi:MAG: hypothetical protein ABIX46_12280 [Burkholderiaceae bacterium]